MKIMKNLTADQIRKSILQLAIQGKLVKQDPNDEPASELVKRIYEEKHRLIKEGKLKKDKNESYIYKGDDNCYYEKIGSKVKNITNELPFEIPQSWEWIRLNNLAKFSLGKTPVRNDPSMWQNGTIPWVSISDLIDKETITKTKENVTQTALKKFFSSSLVHKGTLLMSFKLTIGKVSILGMDAVHNEAIINLLPYIDFNHTIRDYLFFGIGLLASAADKTTAIKGSTLNKGKLAELLIPLPPLKEQLRIISKIKFSEPLILRYQTQLKKIEELENNFEGKIKASILQYAVEGKLVKQDPNDEPASVLLERIKGEKERLIREGKIKRAKYDSEISLGDDKNYYEHIGGKIEKTKDAIPFEIPNNWEWVRLNSIYQHNTGKALNQKNQKGALREYITTSNVYWNYFVLTDLRKMYFESTELEKCILRKGDLLVCEGGDIGRAAIWNLDYPVCIQNHIHRLRPITKEINNKFYYYVFRLYKYAGLIGGKGIGIQGLSTNALGNLALPLPPTNIQSEIVNKIESFSKLGLIM